MKRRRPPSRIVRSWRANIDGVLMNLPTLLGKLIRYIFRLKSGIICFPDWLALRKWTKWRLKGIRANPRHPRSIEMFFATNGNMPIPYTQLKTGLDAKIKKGFALIRG